MNTTPREAQEEQVTDHQIINAMERYGGWFAKSLAETARRADSENLRKIKETWFDLWREYERFVLFDRQNPDQD